MKFLAPLLFISVLVLVVWVALETAPKRFQSPDEYVVRCDDEIIMRSQTQPYITGDRIATKQNGITAVILIDECQVITIREIRKEL